MMRRLLPTLILLTACAAPSPPAPTPIPSPTPVERLQARPDGSYVYLLYGAPIAELRVQSPLTLAVRADTVDQEEQVKSHLAAIGCPVLHDDWDLETGRPFSGDRILTFAQPCDLR